MNRDSLTSLAMRDRVFLSSAEFVGAGTDRECYRHPARPEYCIKILLPERHPRRFRREIRYYRRLAMRRLDWRRTTRYHGMVNTNLGKGAIFDLVLDYDGSVSQSLESCLDRRDPAFDDWAVHDLNALTREFYHRWVVFHDLNPANLLVQRLDAEHKRLVVIDGIGHNHFLSVANYSPAFARRKLVRVWNRRYRQWYASYPAVVAGLERFVTPNP
jgi:hypothetical protein